MTADDERAERVDAAARDVVAAWQVWARHGARGGVDPDALPRALAALAEALGPPRPARAEHTFGVPASLVEDFHALYRAAAATVECTTGDPETLRSTLRDALACLRRSLAMIGARADAGSAPSGAPP